MTRSIATVQDLLAVTSIGNGFHDWPSQGGSIRVTRAELLPALEDAYDSSMPDWYALVDLDA